MCLSLGDVMNEMAGFEVDVCLRAERFVEDQDLDKATTKVLKTFDGKCRAKGWNCEYRIYSTDVLAFLPTPFGKSLLFQLIPGLGVELHNLGYTFFL